MPKKATLSRFSPRENTFAPKPELDGAEITFRTPNGKRFGPYILHCVPFQAGAECILPNGTVIEVTKSTNQFIVRVNGKRTEAYGIRFPGKREKKKTFGYI